MTKDKPGKAGSKKHRRGGSSDWRGLRYAGGPKRPGSGAAGQGAVDGQNHAAGSGEAAVPVVVELPWTPAEDDRWAISHLLEQLSDERQAARRLRNRGQAFFLGLPFLYGLATLARGATPPATDSAVPTLRLVALLTMLGALAAWFAVLRTRVTTRPPLEELGWEPGEVSQRRAGERLVSARRRLEGCAQQARNEVDALARAADRALALSGVSVACLGLLFALAALA